MKWTDAKTGKKYEISYSQELQLKQLRTENLLLACVILLIIVLILGGVYAYWLVQRIDAMNIISSLKACG